jgi:hypothetical protein
MLNVATTDYPVLGIPATTLVIAVFNGVFYGIIAWLAFTLANKAGIFKQKEPTTSSDISIPPNEQSRQD